MIELISYAHTYGVAHIDNLLEEMLLGGAVPYSTQQHQSGGAGSAAVVAAAGAASNPPSPSNHPNSPQDVTVQQQPHQQNSALMNLTAQPAPQRHLPDVCVGQAISNPASPAPPPAYDSQHNHQSVRVTLTNGSALPPLITTVDQQEHHHAHHHSHYHH